MKVFVYVFLLLIAWFPPQAAGQQQKVIAVSKDKDVNAWSADGNTLADTLWFVNFDFSTKMDSMVLKLKLSKSDCVDGYEKADIDWGDGTSINNVLINSSVSSHIYRNSIKPDDGLSCLMTITLKGAGVPDRKVYRKIFNQELNGKARFIQEEKYSISGCMEDGMDTVLVCMQNHLDNPPGTTYKVKVDAGGVKIIPLNEKADSCYVIFTEPNGSVDDEGTQVTYIAELRADINKKTPVIRKEYIAVNNKENFKVHIYAAPDLRKIFGFRDSIDALIGGNLFINVCSQQAPARSDIGYDETMNQKYFYGLTQKPYYREGDKADFTVQYFRKDSIEQADWVPLPSNTDCVDTTRTEENDMKFYKSGLYKIRFEAWNACGGDTLWTDQIPNLAVFNPGADFVRYIKVSESGEGNLYSYQDTGCLRKAGDIETDTVIFADKGKRIALDFYPGYSFQVDKVMKSAGGQDSIVTYNLKAVGESTTAVSFYEQKTWLKGNVLDKSEWENKASDSVVMKLVFKEVGTYHITLSRGSASCDTVKYTDTVRIGAAPRFKDRDLLLSAFTGAHHSSDDTIDMCGAFSYVFPSDLNINKNNLELDTVAWYFKNGNHEDFARIPDSAAYHFSRTGDILNRLKVTARNYCGEDTLSVLFYTRVTPKVKLWRDSIPDNDSLCMNFTYDYFFKGELPEFYTIKASFDQPVDSAGTPKRELTIYSDSVIRTLKYTKQETVQEKYVITNDKNTTCVQTSEWKSVFVLQPDSLGYRDSIMHCTGFQEFKGQKLFKNANPRYKSLLWTYNGRDAGTDNDPLFPLRDSANDTLQVKISTAKGCYVNQQIIFIPKAAPTFGVESSVNTTGNLYDVLYCAVDTIPYLDIVNINTDKDSVAVSVYKQTAQGKDLVYGMNGSAKVEKPLVVDHSQTTPEKFYIRYELENKKVTPGFGDCTLADSILVNVSKPRLKVKSDTVRDKLLQTYDFSTVQADTNQITIAATDVWKKIGADMQGTLSSNTSLYDAKYTLHNNDAQNLDSLLFEVEGTTRCGDILKDTLVVFISRGRIFTNPDTICEDTKNYRLWGEGKTWGEFIDTATLKWSVVKGSGTLSASAKGSAVGYTPAVGDALLDSVEIEVKGTVNFSDIVKTDTVILKVTPKPYTTLSDTLWISDDATMVVNAIPAAGRKVYNAQSYEWKVVNAGSWTKPKDMDQAVYNWGSQINQYDMIQQVYLEMQGNRGCGIYRDTVRIVRSGKPAVAFKYEYDLCEGDRVRLDSAYTITGTLRNIKLRWTKPLDAVGSFSSDSTWFVWASGSPQPASLKLEVDKVVPNYYKGGKQGLSSRNSASNKVNIFQEPQVSLSQKYDTLCHNVNTISIPANRITVSPQIYKDSLRYDKSIGITGTFPDFTMGSALTDTAKVIVYTSLGRCKKWIDKKDTLYLVHIPLVVVEFNLASSVCENGKAEITGLKINGPHKDSTWTISPSGTSSEVINEGDKIFYVPNLSTANQELITLGVTTYKGCEPSLPVKRITILRLPDIQLKKRDTICMTNDSYTLPFTQHSSTQAIEWFAGGNLIAKTGQGASNVILQNLYNYSVPISGKKERLVKIKAVITPITSCVGTVEDTLDLILWPKPEITSAPASGTVCQGGELEIAGITTAYAGRVSWTADKGSFSDANKLNTTYYPGENPGTSTLTLEVSGEKGCHGSTSSLRISITVSPIAKPDFQIPTPLCQNNEIVFTNTTPAGASGVSWEWAIDNGVISVDQHLKHTYPKGVTAITSKVTLQESISGCSRSVEKEITINALPVPSFKATTDGTTALRVLGKDISYNFVNETPGDNSFVWKFQKGNSWDQITNLHTNYTFNDSYATPGAEVRLIAKNRFECVDSISQNYEVVEKPVVSFTIDPNSCGGEAKYTYTGTKTPDMVLDWDLGNGLLSRDSIEFTTQYPASNYGDTVYYVSLKVTNAAAPEGVVKTDSVKIISNLTPTLNVVGGVECKSPIDVYLDSQLCLGRPDSCWVDWGDGNMWEKDSLPKKNILHSYQNDTENQVFYYTIKLRVKNVCHDVNTAITVPIYPNTVQASISADRKEICWGEEVVFTNHSKGFDGQNVQSSWNFGEGDDPEVYKGPVLKVTHPFMKPGTYRVTMESKDKCNHAKSQPIVIHVQGDRSLTFDVAGNYCSAQDLKMSVPDSLTRDNRFFDYKWEFGDGNYDYNGHSRITHKYMSPQTYRVRLVATALGTNCTSEWVKDIPVKRTPRAAIGEWSETTGCAPLTVTLAGTGGLGNDETWWTFGDGNEEQRVEQVKHTYPLDGTYTVAFKIRSPEGCSDSTTLNIHVKPTPQPSFDILSDKLFCTPDGAVEFNLRNTTPLIDASTYKWYYSGKNEPFSMEARPSVFSGKGIFGELALKVVATHKESGCVNTYIDSIISSHSVEADLQLGQDEISNICATLPVKFRSISRYGNLFTWDLGDGTFVRGDSVFDHAYDKPGEYTVKLDVRNKYGCADNISRDFVVYPLPEPQFIFEKDNRILPEDGVPDDLISTVPDVDNGGYLFTNQSMVRHYPFAKDQRLNFTWDLTDTVFANYNEKELFHRFKNNGLYDITLYATTAYGCLDSVSDVVRIATVKGLFVPTAFAPSDPRTEVNRFQPKGIGLSSYKMQVYDFRGMCVWSTTKLEDGHPAEYWDGTINGGVPADKDTYLWKGRAVFVDGTVWEQSGGVVLIR